MSLTRAAACCYTCHQDILDAALLPPDHKPITHWMDTAVASDSRVFVCGPPLLLQELQLAVELAAMATATDMSDPQHSSWPYLFVAAVGVSVVGCWVVVSAWAYTSLLRLQRYATVPAREHAEMQPVSARDAAHRYNPDPHLHLRMPAGARPLPPHEQPSTMSVQHAYV